MRILVAEDEADMNALIVHRLKKEGYAVDTCFDGNTAWDYLTNAEYDAAVLDIMMPGCDGISLTKRLREEGYLLPILFLTARDTIDDKVDGLDSGANDYLVKPFSFRELIARLRVLTRKQEKAGPSGVLCVDDLVLDTVKHTVVRAGKNLDLPGKEFAILEYLMKNRNVVISRDMMIAHVCSYDYEGASNMMDVYISRLRKKVDSGSQKKLIHTIRNVGYVIKEES